MIDLPNIILEIALIIGLYMTIVFLMAILRRDNSIADIAWGLGFIMVSGYSIMQSGVIDLRKGIVFVLVLIWGFRLSVHIFRRNAGRGEDFRYRAWRQQWKFFYLRSFLQVFMLQGFFMLIISAPLWMIGYSDGGRLGPWDTLGLILFGTGFLIEALADYQLEEFRKDPANRGKLMTTGLWAVSRHPNYFGEALLWWGFGLYAMGMPGGWVALAGPLMITLLLRFVSGVPMMEKNFASHPDWPAYRERTAAFVPFVRFL